jgi:toxin ParE1/3/4
MSRTYRVRWARGAGKDLKEIIDFIAADSPSNAIAVLKRIKKPVSTLFTDPERGRIVPELRDLGIFLYREMIIPPWRIICELIFVRALSPGQR